MTEREGDKVDDPFALVQRALRESYMENTEGLRDYAEKVRHFNKHKRALRKYLTALRMFKTSVLSTMRERGVDLCRGNKNDLAVLTEVFEEHAHAYDVGDVEYELGIPDRVPPVGVKSVTLLDNETAGWDQRLATVGDDAQLANIDLQNALQHQQQTLQMMSNISKSLHDSAMSVIRKMGG